MIGFECIVDGMIMICWCSVEVATTVVAGSPYRNADRAFEVSLLTCLKTFAMLAPFSHWGGKHINTSNIS